MTNEKAFTATEVGTMFDSLKSEIRIIAEVVVPLREDMIEVKSRLTAVETEVRSLKDVMKIAIPALSQRVTLLETKIGI